jgi:hypothetical protein
LTSLTFEFLDNVDKGAMKLARRKLLRFAAGAVALPTISRVARAQAPAGVDMRHVPYRGAGPALTDLLGGQGNAPHCFQKSADDMRTFAMPASRNLDRGSVGEAA